MRYEVRCCCRPEKLVGWLEMPEREKGVFTVPLVAVNYWDASSNGRLEALRLEVDILSTAAVNIADLLHENDEFLPKITGYKAIKAEDVPIETLKRIPGFIPNE